MTKNTVIDLKDRTTFTDSLTELIRAGAQQLISQAVQAELDEQMGRCAQRVTDQGGVAVVRSGYQPEREIQTGIGPVTVKGASEQVLSELD